MKNIVSNKTFGEERALYALTDASVEGCIFAGEADGESALKECRGVKIHNCRFDLRYPLWHAEDFSLTDSFMAVSCRAPMWYTKLGTIRHCHISGVKALRECDDTLIDNSKISSPEFGWKCRKVNIRLSDITSEYLLFDSRDVEISQLTMRGKYSFQYVENMTITDSYLDTKDAFWHSKNVTVTNSTVKGEYLGWYSENLTLIDCHISGTQPLCYCKGLKLINCTMDNTDLSFEYSDVEADISGTVMSVKNPRSGYIKAYGYGEIILEDAVMETNCKIEVKDLGIADKIKNWE